MYWLQFNACSYESELTKILQLLGMRLALASVSANLQV